MHNSLGLPLHVTFPIRADQWLGDHLGMGTMPTVWVQEHFHPGTAIPWYGVLVSLVYCSHFLVMPIVAIVLWIRNRARFRVWMNMVIVLAVGRGRDVLPLPDGAAVAGRRRPASSPAASWGATPPRASTRSACTWSAGSSARASTS